MKKNIICGILIGFLAFSSCSSDNDTPLDLVSFKPNSAVFFGNSLLLGFGTYGMAASQFDKDYYYLITTYLTTLDSSFTARRYSCGNSCGQFEFLTSYANIYGAIQSIFLDNLTGNEELVVLQIGDNVYNSEMKALFPVSSLKLCQAIREKCPNAKVVWMGLWLEADENYQAIQNACDQTGCTFISFSDLIYDAAKSKIGNLTKRGECFRTLNNVTNVVINTATNITVTFSVGLDTYKTTLEVSSFSLHSGILTYSSEYEIISDPGVALHPGDNGFRLIANKFLYKMKLTTSNEYYK